MPERIVLLAYLLGWWVVRNLPEKAAYGLFEKLSQFVVSRNGKSVQRLRSNLLRVQPGATPAALEILVARGISSYLRYWCDTFRIQDWDISRIQRTVTTTNDHLIFENIRNGNGVVITLPHSGNWDHAGAYFCSLGIPLVTVAERIKPEALFQKFLSHRERMGFEVLALDSRSIVTLMKRARENRLIALVSDRDLSQSGIDVNFFGHPSRMPAGPALLAIKTGIPLVAAHVSYSKDGIHIDFRKIEVSHIGTEQERIKESVQRMATLFEIGISQYPQDWHMLQRIWIDGDFADRERGI